MGTRRRASGHVRSGGAHRRFSAVLLYLLAGAQLWAADPRFDPISDQSILEDGGQQLLTITGIAVDTDADIAGLSVQIEDPDLALLAMGPVADGQAQLSITPLPDAFGSSMVTVRLSDDQGRSTSRSFQLDLQAVNDAPRIDPIDPIVLDEDDPPLQLSLSGIGSGAANELQVLQLSAYIADSALLEPPVLDYSGGSSATLTLQVRPDAIGETDLAVIVQDDGGTAAGGYDQTTLLVPIRIEAVDDPPRLVRNETVPVAVAGSATIAEVYVACSDDGPAGELLYRIDALPALGTVLLAGSALTLGDQFSQAAVDDGLVVYRHLGSETGSDAIACTVSDAGGAGFALSIGIAIVQSSDNQAPQLAIDTDPIVWQEEGGPIRPAAGGLVADLEGNLGGGRLQVWMADGGDPADRLWMVEHDGLSVSGVLVSQGDVQVAVLAGGGGGTPLSIDIAAGVDRATVERLLRAVSYDQDDVETSDATRDMVLALSDGAGAVSPAVQRPIAITAVDDPVDLVPSRGSLTWIEEEPPVSIDPELLLADPDSTTISGSATLHIAAGAAAGDQLDLAVGGPVQIADGQVSVDGTAIARLETGDHLTPLRLSWIDQVELAVAQELLRHLRFSSQADGPDHRWLDLEIALIDGPGRRIAQSYGLVVVPVNDAPRISAGEPLDLWTEGDGPQFIDPLVTISDPDSPDCAGGLLRVALEPQIDAADRLLVQVADPWRIEGEELWYDGQLVAIGSLGGAVLLLDLQAACTPAIAQDLLRSIAFTNEGTTPGTATRSIGMRIDDGDGGQSATRLLELAVQDRNGAPSLSATALATTHVENTAAVLLLGDALVGDD
ncbi:MAG: cadherin-like domain-containing protein, partial [Planctomycetota bacterium]